MLFNLLLALKSYLSHVKGTKEDLLNSFNAYEHANSVSKYRSNFHKISWLWSRSIVMKLKFQSIIALFIKITKIGHPTKLPEPFRQNLIKKFKFARFLKGENLPNGWEFLNKCHKNSNYDASASIRVSPVSFVLICRRDISRCRQSNVISR